MKTNHEDLAGYLTKSLDAEQLRQFEEHLAGCAECRAEAESLQEWTMALEAVPEAMLLDGPPEGGDLLLQRTLRQIRDESAGRRHRQSALVGAAAAVVVAAAIASGVVVGRSTAEPANPIAQPPATVEPTTIPGTKTATALDPDTGARITVAVAPAPGWVRIKAAVVGSRPASGAGSRSSPRTASRSWPAAGWSPRRARPRAPRWTAARSCRRTRSRRSGSSPRPASSTPASTSELSPVPVRYGRYRASPSTSMSRPNSKRSSPSPVVRVLACARMFGKRSAGRGAVEVPELGDEALEVLLGLKARPHVLHV